MEKIKKKKKDTSNPFSYFDYMTQMGGSDSERFDAFGASSVPQRFGEIPNILFFLLVLSSLTSADLKKR